MRIKFNRYFTCFKPHLNISQFLDRAVNFKCRKVQDVISRSLHVSTNVRDICLHLFLVNCYALELHYHSTTFGVLLLNFFFDSLKAETESDLSVTAFPFSVPPLIEIFLLFFYQTSLVYFSFVICFPLLFFPSFSEKDNNAVILAFNPEPWVE
ncbi:hypothetical protein AB4K20DRAFT_1870110 [Rhizopus microsporus]|uniref:Uncharacterized protein n=1 Tax=Rhizopus microsporus TaxID=58291 RepID=A0A1X0RRQ9_RHIZD|nr:hypothetical protein BCV71DRAFT_275496 [Rhizopus microsporus]